MSKLQEEFDISQCWGTAVTADRFRWLHDRGVSLVMVDAEDALEEASESVEQLRDRYRAARRNGWKTDRVVDAGKSAAEWLDFCEFQADRLDRQLMLAGEEPDIRDEHPVLCVLRGMWKSVRAGRLKGTTKLCNWLVTLLAWADDEHDLLFKEMLQVRAGAVLLLRAFTQHPSWIAEVVSSQAALTSLEKEVVYPTSDEFTNSLSATEDAMLGLIEVRRDAQKLMDVFGVDYESAVLSIVDPD